MKFKEGDLIYYNPEPYNAKRPWYKTKVIKTRIGLHAIEHIHFFAYVKGLRGKNKGVTEISMPLVQAIKDGIIVPFAPTMQILFSSHEVPRGYQDLLLAIPCGRGSIYDD